MRAGSRAGCVKSRKPPYRSDGSPSGCLSPGFCCAPSLRLSLVGVISLISGLLSEKGIVPDNGGRVARAAFRRFGASEQGARHHQKRRYPRQSKKRRLQSSCLHYCRPYHSPCPDWRDLQDSTANSSRADHTNRSKSYGNPRDDHEDNHQCTLWDARGMLL